MLLYSQSSVSRRDGTEQRNKSAIYELFTYLWYPEEVFGLEMSAAHLHGLHHGLAYAEFNQPHLFEALV